MYARFFTQYAQKYQTCAYHVRSKNRQYTNSLRFNAYTDENTFKITLYTVDATEYVTAQIDATFHEVSEECKTVS